MAGQALVAFVDVAFLPPMGEWYSGLLPYPLLLPAQIAILAFQAMVARAFWTGRGVLVTPRPRLGRVLIVASAVYFAAMVVRYAVTMTLHPERRWVGTGTIPIVFHWVLAAWLYVLGHFHASRTPA